MRLLKRLAVSVHSQIDTMSERLENKEAISEAYLREYERETAKAKVKLAQVEREVARQQRELQEIESQKELWATRARKVHRENEAMALQCVDRMEQCLRRHRQGMESLKEMQGLRNRMAHDVERIERQLEEHTLRHQDLAGRQVCVDALRSLKVSENGSVADIDDVFARWENTVLADELRTRTIAGSGDLLAEEFETEERQRALKMTLQELVEGDDSCREEG